jgi:hypothetical protein
MYFVYMDEAGTSASEPVSVVVGIILHADQQWKRAFDELQRTLCRFVPEHLRSGYIFHAKDIWNGYRGEWDFDVRRQLVAEVASIPRRLNAAISLGIVRRNAPHIDFDRLKQHELQHVVAFTSAISEANKFIRDRGSPGEIAAVIAEDVHNLRRELRTSLDVGHAILSGDRLLKTKQEEATGREPLASEFGGIDRVIDTIHFVEKDGAPLLQIADACAFSFRRYFSEQKFGDSLIESMLGKHLILEDWMGPSSYATFPFDKRPRQNYRWQ